MRFSLRTMFVGVLAVALLVTQWPPYRFGPGPYDEPRGFNEDFWIVLGLELAVVAALALIRHADAARRALDEESTSDRDLSHP